MKKYLGAIKSVGYIAAEKGTELEDNPYKKGSLEHDAWNEGWLESYDDHQYMKDIPVPSNVRMFSYLVLAVFLIIVCAGGYVVWHYIVEMWKLYHG